MKKCVSWLVNASQRARFAVSSAIVGLASGAAFAEGETPASSFDVTSVDAAVNDMGTKISGVLTGSVQTNMLKVLGAVAVLTLILVGFRWMFRKR